MAQLPMSKERRICAAKPIKPVACSFVCKISLKVRNRLSVYSSRSLVGLHRTVGGARLDLLHSPGERCYPLISGESCRVGT